MVKAKKPTKEANDAEVLSPPPKKDFYGGIDSSTGRPEIIQSKLEARLQNALKSGILDLSNPVTSSAFKFNFTAIPAEVNAHFEGTQLRELWLTNNRISLLSREIALFPNLKVLGLGGNYLQVLPPEICQLTNLERLCCENNQLTSIPPEISALPCLKELRLDGNNFSEFPVEVTRARGLVRLGLSNNRLKRLAPEIGRLKLLAELDLDHNELGPTLPAELAGLSGCLRSLGLDGNRLAESLPVLKQLRNLQIVRLSGNRCESGGGGGEQRAISTDTVVGYNDEAADWVRGPATNDVRELLKARAKQLPWRTENRLEKGAASPAPFMVMSDDVE